MSMTPRLRQAQDGFTLLELLIAMALTLIVMGAMYSQIHTASQRSANEQKQMDLFQEAREFMDQLSRDLRQVGYPNPRNFDINYLIATATLSDTSVSPAVRDPASSPVAALGLVSLDEQNLSFEGGLYGSTGNVLSTSYTYDPSTTGNCPCLKRSQATIGGGQIGQVEVQNVQNYADPNNPVKIFTFYTDGGIHPVPYPPGSGPAYDRTKLSTDPANFAASQNLAAIDTIKITLVVQSPYADLKTGTKPVTRLVSTVKINNCMQAPATNTAQLSCAW
jgi:prepilin-type N-terminal cleavage/methylation domain-containing protein